MARQTLVEKLGLKYPLIVAPMAGGPTSVELVAESSNAGALGSIGAAYSTLEGIRDFTSQVRALTKKPIAINLFIQYPQSRVNEDQLTRANEATKKYRKELALPDSHLSPPYEESFDAQFEEVLALKPTVLSFVFGILNETQTREARKNGIYLIGTATSFDEAKQLQESGVDAITLQGIEAGGHRGIFDVAAKDPEVPVLELLRQCKGKIALPLIAAGGILNKDHIKSALSLGAQAVQMGTAFLLCQEAGTSIPYRSALLSSANRSTKTTRAFSGRLARGLTNRFMKEIEAMGPDVVLPFPAQNKFTRDLRNASAKKNFSDFLSLWCGTGEGKLWQGPCKELIHSLFI